MADVQKNIFMSSLSQLSRIQTGGSFSSNNCSIASQSLKNWFSVNLGSFLLHRSMKHVVTSFWDFFTSRCTHLHARASNFRSCYMHLAHASLIGWSIKSALRVINWLVGVSFADSQVIMWQHRSQHFAFNKCAGHPFFLPPLVSLLPNVN